MQLSVWFLISAALWAAEGGNYGRIITSCGPEGNRKLERRSWFSFRVVGTSKVEILISLVHEPMVQ